MIYVRAPGVCLLVCFILLSIPVNGLGGTVSGTITYQDKLFSGSPPSYQGTQLLPVRAAYVEVVLSDTGAVLGSGDTDTNGQYSITVTSSGTLDVSVGCCARTVSGSIKVTVPGGSIHVLSGSISDLDTGIAVGGNDFVASISGGGGGAFNIFDVLYGAYMDITSMASATPPDLTANWQLGVGSGTYYDSNSNTMAVQSLSSDPDEFDDAVILHEFGHYVSFEFSRDDSAGGPHSLSGHLVPMLAWSEGWASFYSSYIRDNRYYLDTIAGNDIGILVDLEALASFPAGTESDNEVAVAAVLWDIIDNDSTESFDTMNSAFSTTIWDVMENYFTLASLSNTRNLETFWDGWFARNHGSEAAMTAIFEARGIEYSEDAIEDDDSLASADTLTMDTEVHHSYYPAGDEDWAVFDAVPGRLYTVETLNMANAADTTLELYRPGETTYAAQNDDRASSTTASSILLNPAAAGTYAVKSASYSESDAWTRYGSYDLKVSYETMTLAQAGSLTKTESGGTTTLRWTFPAGSYDGAIVAKTSSATAPTVEFIQDTYSVYGGTVIFDGDSATSLIVTSPSAGDRYYVWIIYNGYISDPLGVGETPSTTVSSTTAATTSSGGGGGGCFLGCGR